MQYGSLFAGLPLPDPARVGRGVEQFDTILDAGCFRLERIVSTGQSTPSGEWLVQDEAEWVVLLTGSAMLRFESPARELHLQPGDWVQIPPRSRHRVDSTPFDRTSVWLAVHYRSQTSAPPVTEPADETES